MAEQDQPAEDKARQTRRRRFAVFGAVLAAAAIGGLLHLFLTRNLESTDDAFVEADIIRIAPQVGGPVLTSALADNRHLDKGETMLVIDPRDYEIARDRAAAALDIAKAGLAAAEADLALAHATTGAAVDQAESGVAQARHQVDEARQQVDVAKAEAERADADAARYADLVRSAVASRQRYDQALAEARSANARLKAARLAALAAQSAQAQAEARLSDARAAPSRIAQKEAACDTARGELAQARAQMAGALLDLSYTRLDAPASGRIAKRAVNPGDLVQKNQVLASLVVDPPWVVANFKETQLERMRPGQSVAVRIDAFPGQALAAHIDSIQPGSGTRFSLLPAENATGNYVKVVQRIPVKILFDRPDDPLLARLAPGMSVVPEVDLASGPAMR